MHLTIKPWNLPQGNTNKFSGLFKLKDFVGKRLTDNATQQNRPQKQESNAKCFKNRSHLSRLPRRETKSCLYEVEPATTQNANY